MTEEVKMEEVKAVVKPMSEKIREYKEANPKATTKQIAEAVGAPMNYVQSRLYVDRKKSKAKRGRPPKAKALPKQAPPAGSIVFVPIPPLTKEAETQQHPLYDVFTKAIHQAMYGKGERHGGARTPFLEQPWAHYAKLHGRGFLTGQAAKKLEEAASTREGTAFEDELLGAIVYVGMAIINDRIERSKR
jgi:hypothetical protein